MPENLTITRNKLPKVANYFRNPVPVAYRQIASKAFKEFKILNLSNPLLVDIDSGIIVPSTDLLTNLYSAHHFDSGVATTGWPADFGNKNFVSNVILSVAAGKLNNAISVANNAFLQDLTDADFQFAGGIFTFSLWVKYSILPGTQDDLLKKSNVNDGYILRVSSLGTVTFFIGTGVGFTSVVWTDFNLVVGTWYHIVCGRDGNNIWIQINTEGALNNGKSQAAATYVSTGIIDFFVRPNQPNGTFLLDELLSWENRWLNSDERIALWNNGAGKAYPFS